MSLADPQHALERLGLGDVVDDVDRELGAPRFIEEGRRGDGRPPLHPRLAVAIPDGERVGQACSERNPSREVGRIDRPAQLVEQLVPAHPPVGARGHQGGGRLEPDGACGGPVGEDDPAVGGLDRDRIGKGIDHALETLQPECLARTRRLRMHFRLRTRR